MRKTKKAIMDVQGTSVTILNHTIDTYISLTDIAKHKEPDCSDHVIQNWMRNRNTTEILGTWERLNNSAFKPLEFDGVRNRAGLNSFVLTPRQWIDATHPNGRAKLMPSCLGGHETLNLYAEVITKMPENLGIPPLFRDIFKNVYLPYRGPETLKMFLKVIVEFEYDHSERPGDAFEYLLYVLGSQGDAGGQFRTPRHIIDFMVELIDPKKTATVLDTACVFFNDQVSIDAEIKEMMKEVGNIQQHMRPIILEV